MAPQSSEGAGSEENSSAGDDPVLTSKRGGVGRITVNRPRALNALTLPMVAAMGEALRVWQGDDAVKAVVVDGAGDKAFCAGGDIRMLVDSGKAGDGQAKMFWSREYALNVVIKRYAKPYVAIMDGVTMGGGVGISVHGGFRVATERTVFAMPETGIGFYPDVGGTYFLPRLPGRLGVWMGLTGARLSGADALAAGLATHFVASGDVPALLAALEREPLDDDGVALEELLHVHESDAGGAPLASQLADINRLFAGDSVGRIVADLEADGGAWALKQLEILGKKSPTSLKVTLRAIGEGMEGEFEDVMARELALSTRFVAAGSDFYEGVRAVIIDKDHAPRWSPGTLGDVSDADVDRFFSP